MLQAKCSICWFSDFRSKGQLPGAFPLRFGLPPFAIHFNPSSYVASRC